MTFWRTELLILNFIFAICKHFCFLPAVEGLAGRFCFFWGVLLFFFLKVFLDAGG